MTKTESTIAIEAGTYGSEGTKTFFRALACNEAMNLQGTISPSLCDGEGEEGASTTGYGQAGVGQSRRGAVILAAVDFSADSMEVVEYAMKVAGRAGAHLALAHAIHLNLSERGPANAGRIKAEMRRAATGQISVWVRRAGEQNVRAFGVLDEGKPADVIVKHAKRLRAELVVLTRRRKGGLERWFRRKTAEKVIREAHCPVLVLEMDTKSPMATIK